jgi:hypothetical protein
MTYRFKARAAGAEIDPDGYFTEAGLAEREDGSGFIVITAHRSPALDSAAAASTSWHCFNRLIGQLYHCLKQGRKYDELLAFGAPPTEGVVSAA